MKADHILIMLISHQHIKMRRSLKNLSQGKRLDKRLGKSPGKNPDKSLGKNTYLLQDTILGMTKWHLSITCHHLLSIICRHHLSTTQCRCLCKCRSTALQDTACHQGHRPDPPESLRYRRLQSYLRANLSNLQVL
jgi:hypothetical protein